MLEISSHHHLGLIICSYWWCIFEHLLKYIVLTTDLCENSFPFSFDNNSARVRHWRVTYNMSSSSIFCRFGLFLTCIDSLKQNTSKKTASRLSLGKFCCHFWTIGKVGSQKIQLHQMIGNTLLVMNVWVMYLLKHSHKNESKSLHIESWVSAYCIIIKFLKYARRCSPIS